MTYSVAFIGTGPDPETKVGGSSFAMAYEHAAGYRAMDDCELVACADIEKEHAEAFADQWEIDRNAVFEDYEEMLSEFKPEVISICVPPVAHAPITIDCAETGVVRAIHCEKPMAPTWEESRQMATVADENDVQLTFNHQRRFDPSWQTAKRLLDDGEIGTINRVEMGGPNFFDHGTHHVDLCNFLIGDVNVEWVIGQFDYRKENVRYGVHNENQMLASWKYENGVHAVASTGIGHDVVGCPHRLVGTDGVIEVLGSHGDGPALRIRRDGHGWTERDVESVDAIGAGIEHLIECLDTDEKPEIGATNALQATEILFAGYESARRRGRVDFPLEVDDHPLETLVESGEIKFETPEGDT